MTDDSNSSIHTLEENPLNELLNQEVIVWAGTEDDIKTHAPNPVMMRGVLRRADDGFVLGSHAFFDLTDVREMALREMEIVVFFTTGFLLIFRAAATLDLPKTQKIHRLRRPETIRHR